MLILFLPIHVSGRKVKTGLDVLLSSNFSLLQNRKVIILSNPTGVTSSLDLSVDVMFESGAVDLMGIMGPEHEFRGTAQAGASTGTFVDEKTGFTVYVSLRRNTIGRM